MCCSGEKHAFFCCCYGRELCWCFLWIAGLGLLNSLFDSLQFLFRNYLVSKAFQCFVFMQDSKWHFCHLHVWSKTESADQCPEKSRLGCCSHHVSSASSNSHIRTYCAISHSWLLFAHLFPVEHTLATIVFFFHFRALFQNYSRVIRAGTVPG